MGQPSYYAMCKACWEYYGKPPICAVAIHGGSCRRCGKPNDYRIPRFGEANPQDDDPMIGLHAIPTEVILAKDGKLPDELPTPAGPKNEQVRIGVGLKGMLIGNPIPADVLEKFNR